MCDIISLAFCINLSLKLITSSALYHSGITERCEVDSVDFIIAHFHLDNSAEEAFNLPTYL